MALYQARDSLEELLRDSTVRVVTAKQSGTGFFVGHCRIVTCAHVVEGAQAVKVSWNGGQDISAAPLHVTSRPFPDLGLLQVEEVFDHPSVLLHPELGEGDTLYGYGYTDEYPNGDSFLFDYEGPADRDRFLRLRSSQVRPGSSGSPLLNRRTGAVCGILRVSRSRSSDLGGRGVSAKHILEAFGSLAEIQRQCHSADSSWIERLNRDQLRITGKRVTEKRFYLAVLDGQSPADWRPFNGSTLKDISTKFEGRPRIATRPYPDKKIYIGLRLDKRDDLLDANLSRVFGVIIDGRALVEGRAKPVNDARAHLEMLVSRALEQNPLITVFGFCVCATFPDENPDEFDYLHREISKVLKDIIGEKCDRRVAVLTHDITLEVQLQNELSRFFNTDPVLY